MQEIKEKCKENFLQINFIEFFFQTNFIDFFKENLKRKN